MTDVSKTLYIFAFAGEWSQRALIPRTSLKAMLFLGLASLIVGTCLGNRTAPESKEAELARASNDFAFELLKSSKNDKNYFVSPLSISTALALVYLGTEGSTSDLMSKVLKYDQYGLSYQDVHDSFEKLLASFNQNTDNYQLSSFNEVLVQKDFTILHIYGHALKQYYSAQIDTVNFATDGEQIKTKINADVAKATKGKIENFLDQPPSVDTKLFLLNAVYFLGNWENPFSPNFTYSRSFYNNGINETKVQMMHRDAQYKTAVSDELAASFVILPYKGEKASLIVVLPDERDGVAAVQQKLNQTVLENVLAGAVDRRLQLILPKFNLSYSKDLVDTLTGLGLGELFGDEANLSRMVGDHTKLKVSKVAHKAVIEVNERGSVAAAATGIEIIPLSIPPMFNVNCPFLFFIRDEPTGMILFQGRVDEL